MGSRQVSTTCSTSPTRNRWASPSREGRRSWASRRPSRSQRSGVTWIRLVVAAGGAVAVAFGGGASPSGPHPTASLVSPAASARIEAISGPTAELEGGEASPPMHVAISASRTAHPPRARPSAPAHRAPPKRSSAPVSRSGLAAQPPRVPEAASHSAADPRAGPTQDASVPGGGSGSAERETGAEKGAERAAGTATGARGKGGNEAGPSPAEGASEVPGATAPPTVLPHVPRLIPPSVITQA